MIYIISEDYFFTTGLTSLLQLANMNAIPISLYEFSMLNSYITNTDIILMCIQSRDAVAALTKLTRHSLGKIIYFIDTAIEKVVFNEECVSLLSKKISSFKAIKTIKRLSTRSSTRSALFSSQEVIIMDLLTEQKDANRIARKLKLSVKTVCAHKMNALRKMGVNQLNARSILLYESIFKMPSPVFYT